MNDPNRTAGDAFVSHLFDAPPEAVFAAWMDPAQVARWWAPDGLEIPLDSVVVEPRIGGRFELTMVERDGPGRFPYRAEFVELTEPELIVLRAEPIPESGIEETMTRVVIEREGERTRMTVTSGPYSEQMRENAQAGWLDAVANLERVLSA